MVYIAYHKGTGLTKVGYSKNTMQRMKQLGTILYKEIEGNRTLEAEIHHYLKKFRHHGEWFSTSPQSVEFEIYEMFRGKEIINHLNDVSLLLREWIRNENINDRKKFELKKELKRFNAKKENIKLFLLYGEQ